MISKACGFCGASIEGDDLGSYGLAGLEHVRQAHPDMPYPDMAVRNYFEGTVRMTGATERRGEIGPIEVHPVTPDRIDDWLDFFDHDALVDIPEFSACYCLEPHAMEPDQEMPELHWTERRSQMIELLRSGTAIGYLAYVDGQPAGWVNASLRCHYALHRQDDPTDETTVGVSCFVIAPPFRGHGVARALLDRLIADAPGRGADSVEAYPFSAEIEQASAFRGPRALYDATGFTEVAIRERDRVVRRRVDPI
ncbi:MAG: N-acetyltransferase family protein [Acidimicrobiales bacterium]